MKETMTTLILKGETHYFSPSSTETTGFSIYSDHIADIGAKVIASLIPHTQPTFSSLVETAQNIPAAGIYIELMTIL